ncbi:MAG: PhzF family phenazine biosynthesis protein [Enhygromyxa sp.]
MNAWHCEVFVDESPGSGNPALVVPQLPVVGQDDYPVVVGFDPGDPTFIRFAAPKGPLPFCGHGSLAAAWVLGRELGLDRLTLRTDAQVVRAEVEGTNARIWIPPARSAREIVPSPELAAALGEPTILRAFLGDAGSPKWIVELTPEQLDRVRVDSAALAELSRRQRVNGAYLFARASEGHYRARGFNPLTGVGTGEDRATGVAVAGLAACLGSAVVVLQGPPGEPPSRLEAKVDDQGVMLSGRVRGRALETSS